MQLFFAFLLLFNDFAPSRLFAQVQGPSIVTRGFVGKGGLEKGIPWLCCSPPSGSASLTLSLSVFRPVEAGWSVSRLPLTSLLSRCCPLPPLPLLCKLTSALLTLPHPLALHSKCRGRNEIQAAIPHQMVADTLIFKCQCLCS